MHTPCQIDMKNHSTFKDLELLNEQVKLSTLRNSKIRLEADLPKGKTHFVTVKAKVKGFSLTSSYVSVFYDRIEIYQSASPSNSEDFLFWMLVFSLLLFFTSLAGCLLYYKKYRKADKILTYEMQDIKNAVQFSGMNLSISEDSQQSIDNNRIYVGFPQDVN